MTPREIHDRAAQIACSIVLDQMATEIDQGEKLHLAIATSAIERAMQDARAEALEELSVLQEVAACARGLLARRDYVAGKYRRDSVELERESDLRRALAKIRALKSGGTP